MELTKLEKKIDDLENRSKRNNIVIWGLREDAEKEYESLEFFLAHNFFGNQMGIEGIEVMRAEKMISEPHSFFHWYSPAFVECVS